MLVEETAVRAMFVALGKEDFADRIKVPRTKVQKKMNGLPTLVFPVQVEDLDKEHKLMYKKILEGLQEGIVELRKEEEQNEEFSSTDKSSSDKSSSASSSSTDKKKGKKVSTAEKASDASEGDNATKDPTKRDRFRCRIGAGTARINEQLTEKAKTAEEIALGAGIPIEKVKPHLQWLLRNAYITRNENNTYEVKE